MVGEEKRGGAGASGSAGFQLPSVNWALAAEEPEAPPSEGERESGARSGGNGTGGATAPLPQPIAPPASLAPDPESEPEPDPDPTAALAVPAPAASAVAAPAVPAPAVAVAAEAAAATVAAEPDTAGESDPGPRPGRVSRPMIAAAVAVGLVLVGTSVVVTRLGHDPKQGPARADNPPGYGQSDGGGSGFAPTFDEHGGTSGSGGTPAPDGQGGVPAPAPDGGTAAPGDQPAAVPNAGAPVAPGQPAHPGAAAPGTGGTDTRSQGGSGASGGSSGGSGGGSTGGGSAGGSTGGSSSSGGGAVAPPPAAQQPAPPPKPAPVVAVAGPYCDAKGSVKINGWFDQGVTGWHKNSGGWSSDGCNGTYVSMPMSGAANKDDTGNSVVWSFSNLGNVTSCAVAVYIPASGDAKNVGGNPSVYTVSSGGSFNINQTAYRGSWVNAGTFPYQGGLSVTLHSRGVDWGGNQYAHHAASAVRATCTP
ncbi:hypothetical protein [Streptomyces sp. NRRL WC-3742]|uniref:hypothetical protein n=1 Tax=Streptomyces sp. NRRL WC-3742 TaxID=1463934 RepID=UPI0004CA6A22|nr:hypothetical protein [Streptomyces sp. NRRL WC-3742]